jgi:hypothetical protein
VHDAARRRRVAHVAVPPQLYLNRVQRPGGWGLNWGRGS